MTFESLFDRVPMHKEFKSITSSLSPINGKYPELLQNINLFFDHVGKDLKTVKKDIKNYSYGDEMKQIIKERKEKLEKRYEEKPLQNFVMAYENTWRENDLCSIKAGALTLDLITKKNSEKEFLKQSYYLMKQAINKDINLHAYTFALQPVLNKHKVDDIVVPFEFALNEDCILSSEEEFAKKYTYGDVQFARECIKKCSALSLQSLDEIAENIRLSYFGTQKDCSFYWKSRLYFWEAFEEPRRRFSALYGLFDYFFRETVFSLLKEENNFEGKTSALQIPQHEILNKLEITIKNG